MRRVRRPLVALVALVVALVVGYVVQASSSDDPSPRPSVSASTGSAATGSGVALSRLPVQARETIALIERGGPFPYPSRDGSVFRNSEHRLPAEVSGYYREYTVPTPGSDDRGARRIIAGRDGRYWYTGDHYASFRPVDVSR